VSAAELRHIELAPTEALDLSELFADRGDDAGLAA
jgi:hypothetical protein